MLPVLSLLAFTGCTSIESTGEHQKLTNNRVATYIGQSQEQAQPAASDPDPGYEWFC